LVQFPSDWLRLRHNPFYDFVKSRVLEWVDGVSKTGPGLNGDGVD
jgi:hypothetical protein